MSVSESSKKAFVSAVEMAEELSLSKSRFFALIKSGVFPRPIRHEGCKRPVFNLELQEECRTIRQTGIGHQGQPVLFNRMRAGRKPRKQRHQQPLQTEARPANQEDHAQLVEAMKSLGLTATNEAVAEALTALYPTGIEGIDRGELIRRVFLHLRSQKQ
jgi:hypothetical protein